jgi:hypothetical protein
VTITVAGPDGAGKTTFCDALVGRVLSDRDVRRVHHRFGLLPVRNGAVPTARPHAHAPYPPGLSEAKVLYLFTESLAAWLLWARPFVRSGGVLLTERGWWDLAVDPRRYRLRAHPRLVGGLGRLLPRSDLLIVLEGPAELLAARKDESSREELARQLDAWHQVVPARQRRIYLDGSLPLEDTVSRAVVALEAVGLRATRRNM